MRLRVCCACVLMLLLGSASVLHTAADPSLMIDIPRFGFIQDMKERVDLHMAPNYLLLPHVYRAFINAGASPEFMANYSVSSLCQNDLQHYYNGLVNKKAWAWKMYDSTGKQPAGIFIGTTTWGGNYDECLSVPACSGRSRAVCNDHTATAPQYCSVFMTHAPWRPKMIEAFNLPFPVPYSPFIIDVCIPKNCSQEDIFNVVDAFLAIDNFGDNITVKYVKCHARKSILEDTAAVVSVCILTVILAFVVLGTTYDIYHRRRKLNIKRGPEVTIGYDDDTDRFGILKIVVPARKHHGRRGTLSSSENIDQAKKKLVYMNGANQFPQHQSASETLFTDNSSLKLLRARTLSLAGQDTELQEISESKEDHLDEAVLTPHESHTNTAEITSRTEDAEMLSDDEASILPGARDAAAARNANRSNITSSLNRNMSIVEVRPSHRNKKLTSSENVFTDLLLSFSFRKNTRHILADGSADTLFCLNGVRVLSISWIVLGNVYGIMYQNPDVVENNVLAVKMTQSLWMQMVINTTLAADSFFVLSGTLMAYNFLKLKTKRGRNKKGWRGLMSVREYGFMIVHRLFRIFPCYAVLLLLATNVLPFLGRGPRWSYEIDSVKVCKKNWWASVLFISNFYDSDNMCQPHTYYLVNDFQFFLFSPVVLIPLLIAPKVGLSLVAFFVLAQMVVVGAINQGINGNVLRMKVNNYFSLIYVKPYSRIGVYCIGLALGYLLFKCDRQMKFRKIPLYLGWVVSGVVIILLPYITYLENREGGQAWSGLQTAVYEAISRPAWALAVSWVIFACSTGQGAFVGKLLSWNMFLPLCRITYGVFLLHPILISVVIESSHNHFYLDFGELIYTYLPILICSWGVAFILISCVECPFTTFESHIRLRFKSWVAERKLKNIQRI
ncbi:hypothetical protein BsWGS_25791 [Bradybaena similaris]